MQIGSVIAIRCGIAAICFAILILFSNRTLFKIKLKDIWCLLPYLLYTFGLTKVETGKASIMASFEVVAATLVGIIIFKEKLELSSIAGIILVLYAVNLLNHSKKGPTVTKA